MEAIYYGQYYLQIKTDMRNERFQFQASEDVSRDVIFVVADDEAKDLAISARSIGNNTERLSWKPFWNLAALYKIITRRKVNYAIFVDEKKGVTKEEAFETNVKTYEELIAERDAIIERVENDGPPRENDIFNVYKKAREIIKEAEESVARGEGKNTHTRREKKDLLKYEKQMEKFQKNISKMYEKQKREYQERLEACENRVRELEKLLFQFQRMSISANGRYLNNGQSINGKLPWGSSFKIAASIIIKNYHEDGQNASPKYRTLRDASDDFFDNHHFIHDPNYTKRKLFANVKKAHTYPGE